MKRVIGVIVGLLLSTNAFAQYKTPAVNSPLFPSTPSANMVPVATSGTTADWAAVTNSVLATAPADTVKCNPTSSTAAVQDCTTITVTGVNFTAGATGVLNAATGQAGALQVNGTTYFIWNAGTFFPNVDNTYNLGAASNRWNTIYSGTSITGALIATVSVGFTAGNGSGGTVGQTGSRSTGVTLNKITGAITLVSAAGSATATTFTVSNSTVAANDVIIMNQASGTNLYEIFITAVGSQTFNVTFFTTGGTATDAPVFNFMVIKGTTS